MAAGPGGRCMKSRTCPRSSPARSWVPATGMASGNQAPLQPGGRLPPCVPTAEPVRLECSASGRTARSGGSRSDRGTRRPEAVPLRGPARQDEPADRTRDRTCALSQARSELLFDVFSRRCGTGATVMTSDLPVQEWTSAFASERLAGAVLNRPPMSCCRTATTSIAPRESRHHGRFIGTDHRRDTGGHGRCLARQPTGTSDPWSASPWSMELCVRSQGDDG